MHVSLHRPLQDVVEQCLVDADGNGDAADMTVVTTAPTKTVKKVEEEEGADVKTRGRRTGMHV